MDQRFPKTCRLLKRQEFSRVYSTGTPYRNTGFHLFVVRRGDAETSRLGLTVTRKAGKAVIRNRLRRWARETFRQNSERIVPGCDVVANFHGRLAFCPRREFDRLFLEVFRKAGLLHHG